MTHSLATNQPQVLAKYLAKRQESLLTSLSHRLEVARATRNFELIELLEQEKRQMTATQAHHNSQWSLFVHFTILKQHLTNAIAPKSALQVSQFVNGSDRWWYIFDPRTASYIYADSEAELKLWLKENYQGR